MHLHPEKSHWMQMWVYKWLRAQHCSFSSSVDHAGTLTWTLDRMLYVELCASVWLCLSICTVHTWCASCCSCSVVNNFLLRWFNQSLLLQLLTFEWVMDPGALVWTWLVERMASEAKMVTVQPLNGSIYPTWRIQCQIGLMKDELWNIVTTGVRSLWQKEIVLWPLLPCPSIHHCCTYLEALKTQ